MFNLKQQLYWFFEKHYGKKKCRIQFTVKRNANRNLFVIQQNFSCNNYYLN